MAELQVSQVPVDERFTAVILTGTFAARPDAEIVGEFYYATDTEQLFVSTAAGDNWLLVYPPDLSFHGVQVSLASATINGSGTLTWATEEIDTDAFFSAPSTDLTIPSGLDGKYRYALMLGTQTAAYSNGSVQINVGGGAVHSYAWTASAQASPLAITGILELSAADVVTILVTESITGTVSVITSRLSLEYLGA